MMPGRALTAFRDGNPFQNCPHIRHPPVPAAPCPDAPCGSSAAMSLRVVAPPARMSAMMGATSRAKLSALAATVARRAAPPFPPRLRLSAPFGLPSFTPRALATASASFVRREFSSRSVSATSAMNPDGQVIRLRHVHGNEPQSAVAPSQEERRDSRSRLAITSVAPLTSTRCSALAKFCIRGKRTLRSIFLSSSNTWA